MLLLRVVAVAHALRTVPLRASMHAVSQENKVGGSAALQVWAGFNVMATAFVGGVFLAFSDFMMRSLRKARRCGFVVMPRRSANRAGLWR